MEFFQSVLEQQFLQFALLASLLSSVVCGVVGPFVYVRRLSYIAGGIAHSVFGGMGFAQWLGVDPNLGAVVMAVISALLVAHMSIMHKQWEEPTISALWAGGIAVGILFLSKVPGYSVDLHHYLFGNILFVDSSSLYLMVGMVLGIGLLVSALYRQWLLLTFDEDLAFLRGLPVNFLTYLFYVLISITVVLLIQVVGLILVIAWLTIPAMIVARRVNSMATLIYGASILNMIAATSGLYLAYELDLPASAIIILVIISLFLISLRFSSKAR